MDHRDLIYDCNWDDRDLIYDCNLDHRDLIYDCNLDHKDLIYDCNLDDGVWVTGNCRDSEQQWEPTPCYSKLFLSNNSITLYLLQLYNLPHLSLLLHLTLICHGLIILLFLFSRLPPQRYLRERLGGVATTKTNQGIAFSTFSPPGIWQSDWL